MFCDEFVSMVDRQSILNSLPEVSLNMSELGKLMQKQISVLGTIDCDNYFKIVVENIDWKLAALVTFQMLSGDVLRDFRGGTEVMILMSHYWELMTGLFGEQTCEYLGLLTDPGIVYRFGDFYNFAKRQKGNESPWELREAFRRMFSKKRVVYRGVVVDMGLGNLDKNEDELYEEVRMHMWRWSRFAPAIREMMNSGLELANGSCLDRYGLPGFGNVWECYKMHFAGRSTHSPFLSVSSLAKVPVDAVFRDGFSKQWKTPMVIQTRFEIDDYYLITLEDHLSAMPNMKLVKDYKRGTEAVVFVSLPENSWADSRVYLPRFEQGRPYVIVPNENDWLNGRRVFDSKNDQDRMVCGPNAKIW